MQPPTSVFLLLRTPPPKLDNFVEVPPRRDDGLGHRGPVVAPGDRAEQRPDRVTLDGASQGVGTDAAVLEGNRQAVVLAAARPENSANKNINITDGSSKIFNSLAEESLQ